jgi:hypothetical protein
MGPKDPRPLASRTLPISPGRDETLQRHEIDKRDSDNRAFSWAMSTAPLHNSSSLQLECNRRRRAPMPQLEITPVTPQRYRTSSQR